jgi:phenylalanyl-tRNA synthetase beta chain
VAAHPALHPGRSARVLVDGQAIGFIGELHPQWQQKYDLPLAPVLFEIDLDPVERARLPQYVEGSRQPVVVRISRSLSTTHSNCNNCSMALSADRPAIVSDIRLFDVYVGRGVEAGKKSLAFRIVMQDTQRTLLEAEVDAAMQQLLNYLQQAFAAQLRV